MGDKNSNSLKLHKYAKCFLILVLLLAAIVKLWPSDLQSPKLYDTITFLGLIFAFAAFASYFLFEMNKRDIETYKKQYEDELKKAIQSGRYYAEAQVLKTAGLTAYSAYNMEILKLKLLIKEKVGLNKNQTSNDPIDKDIKKSRGEASNYINDAIQLTELAIKLLRKLDAESRNELLTCICNNNLAYYLVERGADGDCEHAMLLVEDVKDKVKMYPSHASNWLDTVQFVNQKRTQKKSSSLKEDV